MKALSQQQARRCETAKKSKCRCRCGGLLHGLRRTENPDPQFFEMLPEDDPHHVRSEEEKKRRAKDRAHTKKAGQQGFLWAIFEGENA